MRVIVTVKLQELISLDAVIELANQIISFFKQKNFMSQQETLSMYWTREKLVKEKPNCMKQMTLQELLKKASKHFTLEVQQLQLLHQAPWLMLLWVS